MYEHELRGLNGDNLLAFLAALGTLRVLSGGNADAPDASSATALSWRERGGAWVPVLHHSFIETHAALIEALASRCCLHEQKGRRQVLAAAEQRLLAHKKDSKAALAAHKGQAKIAAKERADAEQAELQTAVAEARAAWVVVDIPAFSLGADLSVSPVKFTDYLRRAAEDARPESREWADYAAAFGSELYPTKYDTIQDTSFRTMSGAGHQHFLGTMVKLHEETLPGDLAHSLFEPWGYADVGLSLRWDAADDRRYALRFYDPGNANASPSLTVRGANRLATEALPLFPTFIVGQRLKTTGFARREKETAITWPIWASPLRLDLLRSLVSLAELQADEPSRTKLEPRGVLQIYRAIRFREGKFYNFSPARALL